MSSPPLKLHLGCGNVFIPGFVHIDVLNAKHVDHCCSVRELPYSDSSIDLIYSSHLLEHFGRWEIAEILSEWYRVLAPLGILRLAVPDFAACAKLYYEKGLQDGLNGIVGLICGGQRNEYDYHKTIFDEPFLTSILKTAGFKDVRRWDWRLTEHSKIDDYSQAYIPHMDKEFGTLMSLNLEAIK